MTGDPKILDKVLRNALAGTGAHVDTQSVFTALTWKLAGIRPDNSPHSAYEILNHMHYWQEWVEKWMDGGSPPVPKHAFGSWPGDAGPASRKEWDQAVRRFREGLRVPTRRSHAADLLSKRGKKSRLEMLHAIASHNSYHAGQVVFLRQELGAWPPPSGGLTW